MCVGPDRRLQHRWALHMRGPQVIVPYYDLLERGIFDGVEYHPGMQLLPYYQYSWYYLPHRTDSHWR